MLKFQESMKASGAAALGDDRVARGTPRVAGPLPPFRPYSGGREGSGEERQGPCDLRYSGGELRYSAATRGGSASRAAAERQSGGFTVMLTERQL